MKYETVYLYEASGKVTIYDNKKSAYEALGFSFIAYTAGVELADTNKKIDMYSPNCERKKTHTFIRLCGEYARGAYYSEYVLVNDYREILTIDDFAAIIDEERKYKPLYPWLYDRYNNWNGQGPVPGTGKKTFSHCWRHPKTLAALRASYVCKEDMEPEMRGSRKRGILPTAWDDYRRSSLYDRSWKRFRKTQYKKKA